MFLINPYSFSSVALWTPDDLAVAPAVWLDLADTATITHASGAVSSVSNKGSLGGSFTKGGTTLRTGETAPDACVMVAV